MAKHSAEALREAASALKGELGGGNMWTDMLRDCADETELDAIRDMIAVMRKDLTELKAPIKPAEVDANLCMDEGCPNHGSPHVCIAQPAERVVDGLPYIGGSSTGIQQPI